ncbi:acetyl-CoA synthetase-like protein [Lophiostoma macrostomum CBS 122681]|uniref:Acetyl-CoA synthetase-like protein n=1 Tax=Lophiostoma macrostomum CBS 122681 TaxID=1314788 RepID=A0A6A6SW00_9PLEO|nr:acetyl-CoA synthetase-like protein [Lophiostoma macrostomum CBS 122681]
MFYIQDILKKRAKPDQSQELIFYRSDILSKPDRVTYATLYNEAKRNSSMLRLQYKISEGQPILLHLDDQWDTILWFWSVILAKALPVFSSPFSNLDEHRRKYTRGLSQLLEAPICITRASMIHLFDGDHTLHLHTIESLSAKEFPNENEQDDTTLGLQPSSPAILMLTSGSTGAPKAVPLTHEQVLAAVEGKASVRTLPAGNPFLNWIGLDHVASLIEIHVQAMWLGVDQIHVNAGVLISSPRLFLDLLSRHRVARSFAPNFFLAKLVSTMHNQAHDQTWDFSKLTVLASGGEMNDTKTCVAATSLLERYGAHPNVIMTGFGMTETCAGAIFNLECPSADVKEGRSVTSLGRCMTGINMRVTLLDTERRIADAGEAGDLEVSGSVVFGGYYRNPQATAEAFTADGWFRTGDRAVIDASGDLHLIGRTKDVININGVKFASSDIQSSLEQALGPRVNRTIVFATRMASTERVTVAYVPKSFPMEAEDLMEIEGIATRTCVTSTGSRPLVFSLREPSIRKLPTSSLGKISGVKMRSMLESGLFDEDIEFHSRTVEKFREMKAKHQSVIEVTTEESLMIEDFARTLCIEPTTIGLDTDIFDLGSTSMDLIRLKRRIDVRLDTSVPVVTFMKNPTPRLLSRALTTRSVDRGLESSQSANTEYDPVITLRSSGSKTPLWLIHPGVGEVLVFFGLAQQLNRDDRPIYALRARGFEKGQERFSCIEETVTTYAASIRKVQPRGPYALAGYSYGTMLAFETAKRLNSIEGEDIVQFLGSFNLPPHIKIRMQQLDWNMCLLHLSWFLDLVTEAYVDNIDKDSFRAVTQEGALERVVSTANTGRLQELGLGQKELSRWTDVAFGLQSMAVNYEPSGQIGVIDVFHAKPLQVAASSRQEWLEEHLSKWTDFCKTRPRFHEVGGAHYTMLGPDHVSKFASTLMAALMERGL